MADDESTANDPDDLHIPFIFVKHGDPLPTDWMARHPGWVQFPATLVPRDPAPVDTITPEQPHSRASEGGPAFMPNGMERPASAGAPISVGRFGRRPGGRPPQYPGSFGSGPGGGAGNEDPVAAYLRMSEALWPVRPLRLGGSGVPNVRSAPSKALEMSPVQAKEPESPNAGLHVSDAGKAFIFEQETRGRLSTTRHTYWPGLKSGVTLGPGYDLKFRTPAQIRAELEAIGVDPEKARILSAAGRIKAEGLVRQAAKKFAEEHKQDVTLTFAQQRALLSLIIPQYEAEVRDRVRVSLNQNEFDALVSFDYGRGPGSLKGIADLVNRGDRLQAADEIEHFDDKRGEDYKPRRKAEAELMRRDVAKPQPLP